MALKEIGLILMLTAAGPGCVGVGVWSLRTRAWREGVPALELLIDRAVGADPPPRTKYDRISNHVHAWLLVISGVFFSLCDFAVIYTLLSE